MSKSMVSIVKGSDAQEMVDEALSLLGGIEALIKPGSVVVIKPNAGHPSPPATSVNTNPAVIGAIIQAVKKSNPREIILAEAAAVRTDTLKALDVSGIAKAAKDAGIDRIVDIKRLDPQDVVDVKVPEANQISKFRLPKFLLEADCVIGAPIFKTHVSMVFTAAVKGMKGTVDDKMHRRMHFVDLAQALFDLLTVSPLHLSIVDMIRPQEGMGPMASGTPVDFGAIVAGTDPVAVDATCCRMVGIVPEETYLKVGSERGFGNIEKDLIEVRGSTIKEVFKKLDIPFLKGFANYPDYCIYDENACSSCMGIMVAIMEKLKKDGEYEKHKGISIVFGPKKCLPEGAGRGKDLILVGNCVSKFADKGVFVPGCPPMGSPPYWGITKREDQKEEEIPVETWKEEAEK